MRPLLILAAYLLMLPAVTGHKPGRDIPPQPYSNSHFTTVDSIAIHYRTWNEHLARPKGKILLIHGFCGSTFCWRNNCDALAAAGYRVVTVDLPGFGYSGRSARVNQSQSNRARMIREVLDRIDQGDTTRWNIVGHSMGGGTAEAFALMYPLRTRSLIVVDGMVFIHNDNVTLNLVGLVNHPVYKKLLLSYAENSYLSFDNLRRTLKGTYGFIPDSATTLGYWEPLQVAGTAETIVNMLANSREIDNLHARDLGKTPVLIIWGKKDKTIRLSHGKKFRRAVSGSILRVIPDARHMPMETHANLFNATLLDFLEKNGR
ncbi:MAG TPA: alpha/beta hydrolase [Bacteroidales bacterium]|nr:alpha/beta hydrolase [Bacteroidales bacterium]HPS62076.1 alpha/beta hydrolase [Bacteroidales bacterium]